ncbi:protein RRNAD1 [Ostrinia furnacalis]|uniref:protein RRNAD1 n=1 Tax=Ostrinia furnacalis TaxID=93504 RepID=UPI00103ABFFD|nr:protein RRNAD1 [Ostrinia furnacalis]
MLSQEETIKRTLKMSLQVIRNYDWLLDLYVLDFFVDQHWEKLPLTWREAFYNMDPQILGNIIDGNFSNTVLPLSFLALMKTVQCLTITRQSLDKCAKKKLRELSVDTCGGHPRLANLFLKHVKLKKRHEISLMAEVVYHTASQTNCNGVLDFGSGLGHLVRVLGYKYNLYAAGIESQTQLTEEARKLDLELEYTASKHLSIESMDNLKRPSHYNMTLSCHSQLLELKLPGSMNNYGLVGLHPCGDLGPLLLKHFIKCHSSKFICLVGCCFMKLTSEGYPMSEYVKGLDSGLSYPSREIACHAIEVYCDRLKKGDYEDLKIHAFRAALERILVGINPALKHAPIRSIKHSDSLTFERYCSLAFERLQLPLPCHEAVWARARYDLIQWRRVVIVYTLRLALAPLVETVILLDRMLYVLEQGLSCEIRPVFDPKISPRNHIMIARRT